MGHQRRRRRGQRGFSLIIVFLLILVMVGVAAAVMVSTQSDLQVSGHDREAASALYAAEAGAAWGENWVMGFATPVKKGTWTDMLGAGGGVAASFCTGGGTPPTALPAAAPVNFVPGAIMGPMPGTPVLYDATRLVYYQWCIHNNAADRCYVPAACPQPGNTWDDDNIITVESWGWVGGTGTLATALASSHITIDIAYSNANLLLANDYAQAGGLATKQSGGESSSTVAGGIAKTF